MYEIEYLDDFDKRRNRLVENIEDMESNPYAYQYLLGDFPPGAFRVHKISRIKVDDDIPAVIRFKEALCIAA